MKTKRDRLTSDKPEEMNNCRVAELCEKLKKYEEICIYPEKLKEISGLFLEKCQEVNRLKADLEKQKNRSSRKQTNADRIREMSDEELIKIIMCPYDISGIPVNMMPCVRNGNIQELIPPEECNKCMMEWLQSEVEE